MIDQGFVGNISQEDLNEKGKRKLHHYVPIWFQRGFTDDDGLLWTADKNHGEPQRISPKTLFAENRLNQVRDPDTSDGHPRVMLDGEDAFAAPALSLEHLILQTATALPPPPPGRAPGALRQYQDSLRGHCQIENPGSLVPVRYNLQRRAMHPCSLRCSSVKYRRYSWSSRLTHEAPHSPRCDVGLSPRTARKARTGNRDIGLLRLARSQYA